MHIDNLVGSDEKVIQAEEQIRQMIEGLRTVIGDELFFRLESTTSYLALAHSRAAFRVGAGYGIRMAREVDALAAATKLLNPS